MTEELSGARGADAQVMAYSEPDDVADVRTFVRAAAVHGGLSVTRAELLVLAVSELATNTLQHAHSGGRVRVWDDGQELVCEVIDSGAQRSFGAMPAADAPRGRGLAIVQAVVDEYSTFTSPDGTVVQLRMTR
jgi:serine/threonine-protein kinase RsbW